MRHITLLPAVLLLASSAWASPLPPNIIQGTSLSVSFGGDFATATNVDTLSFSLIDRDYTLDGLLRIQPLVPFLSSNVALNGAPAQSAPFAFGATTFMDLTEVTLTCTLTSGSCGAFSIGLQASADPLSTIATVAPISASVEGMGPAGVDLFGDMLVEATQLGSFIDSGFGAFAFSIPGSGAFNQQLFSSSLNVSGATNISFRGAVSSSTGLSAGEVLSLPNSFTAILGPDPSAVPEPGTAWMLVGGAVALAWFRKRARS